MKLIKKYFLMFAMRPIATNLIIFVAIGFALLAIAAYYDEKVGVAFPLSSWQVLLLLALPFLNMLLVIPIINKYVKAPRDNSYYRDFFLCLLVKEDGSVVNILKPVWSKGKTFFIRKSGNHNDSSNTLILHAYVKGKYFSTTVTIPMTIEIEFGQINNPGEILKALLKDKPDDNHLDLFDYVWRSFEKLNEPNQRKIDRAVSQFARKEITEPVLLDEVSKIITFPERMFEDVKGTKICFKSPSFQSCKGDNAC